MIDLLPYEYNGVKLYIRGEVAAAERMIVREVQESYVWNFDMQYALDIGAHIGSWTLYAKQRYPQAKIAAVEVDALNMLLLRLNTFDVPDTWLYEARCGYEDTPSLVARHRYNSGSTRLIAADDVEQARRDEPYLTFHPAPPVISLEQIIQQCHFPKLDVLKLDCEGAEVEILNHMSDALLSQIQHVVGEIHTTPPVFEHQTGQRLQKHGFQVVYTPHPANPQYSAFHAWR